MPEPLRDTETIRAEPREILDAFVDGYMATDSPVERRRKTQAFVDAMYPALDRLVGRLQAAEQERLTALVAFYRVDAVACAELCDKVLDTSGALLGHVRNAVYPPRAALSVSPAPSEPA